MRRHSFISFSVSLSFTGLLLFSAACSSSTDDPQAATGGMTGQEAGGASASAGSAQVPSAGAGASAGRTSSEGGSGGSASNGASGALGGGGVAAGAGSVSGGGGPHAVGGGGASAMGGQSAMGGSGGARATAGNGGASGGAPSTACPGAGHITYTLAKSASPTATEQAAYDKIKTAMDKAISYYDCYTSITKSLNVSYVPSVATADGNANGSMRFGMDTTYMDYRTAMHEIGHTVGIGQASNWGSFLANGLFTGSHAAAQLKAINAKLSTPLYPDVHADTQHFWPYGINQQSEVKSEADLIAHCQMVVAIRQDLGL